MNECDIFVAALEFDSQSERTAYLDRACQGNLELRRRLEQLLNSHAAADSLLDHPAVEAATQLFADTKDADGEDVSRTTPCAEPIPLDFLEPPEVPGLLGRLGQYDILEVVGRGGMGIVLKAQDAKLNRVVAVKVLAPELASNPTARKRFSREAQAAAAVSHDHVVTIYAVENHAGQLPYLVMEFIDGQSLQQKLDASGPLELKEILRIGRQIAAGLAAAHQQGLIHRDIKPSNILLQNGVQRVQITDFGLARAVDDVGMTKTGEVTGTPQFMSPEQAQGHPVDVRSDLFSLGSVLYAMCTGRSPFRADSSVATLRRVCDDVPRPIREINADTPNWLVDIINRLLEKKPDDRFQTADEVADLLGKHLAHLQDPHSTPFPGTIRPIRSRQQEGARRRYWQAVGLALVVLAATFGVTEATGVTQFSSSVIRIVTGEGTLVIEVDDPTIEISLDGEELTITGAGFQELRLRPGQYQFRATRDGETITQELVTITRGDRQVVRVSVAPAGDAVGGSQLSDPQTDVWRTNVSQLNSQAITLYHQGELDAAIAMFREALALAEVNPSSDLYETVRRNLATTLFNVAKRLAHWANEDQRDPERALELANEAVALYPESGMYRGGIGHALYRLGRYPEAAEAMETGFRLGGPYDQAELVYALILWELGQRDAALLRYDATRQRVELRQLSETAGGTIFTLMAEFDEKLGPEYDGRRADSLRQIGDLKRFTGRHDEAVYFYRQAEELLRNFGGTHPESVSVKLELARTRLALAHALQGVDEESTEAGDLATTVLADLTAFAEVNEDADANGEAARLQEEAEILLRELNEVPDVAPREESNE